MPYVIKKVGKGYKVQKAGSSTTYSKKPLSLERAKAQLAAIMMSEFRGRRR